MNAMEKLIMTKKLLKYQINIAKNNKMQHFYMN